MLNRNASNPESTLAAFASFISRKFERDGNCTRINFADAVEELRDVTWSDSPMRQWIYQTCSEFGWYQTSTSANQPFGSNFPIQFYYRLCEEAYGSA